MNRNRSGTAATGPPGLLRVAGLRVLFGPAARPAPAVDGVDFEIGAGEAVALAGESGCGKTLTALALTRLTPEPGSVCEGRIEWEGRSVLDLPERALQRLRGGGIAYVFQDPLSALNPVQRIGTQVAEAVRLHAPRAPIRERVLDCLRRVGLPDPPRQAAAFPHELSGGMRQRAMIAMAIACRPRLLVADEPTTALDPTVRGRILDLLDDLRRAFGMALLLITHDIAVAERVADRLLVMYAGRVVEEGPVDALLRCPAHPYTRALLDARPGAVPPGCRLPGILGAVPRAEDWPAGCRFHPRCPSARPDCARRDPVSAVTGPGRRAACRYPLATRG